MQEIITTGKTVDEAVEAACAELGLSRDDVTVEIIEMPQKKLFGSKPAQVKVSAIDDGFSVKSLFEKEDKKQAEPKAQPQQNAKFEQRRPEQKKQEQPKEVRKPEFVKSEEIPEVEVSENDIPEPAKVALNYLKEMTALMGAKELSFKVAKTERGLKFLVDGEDSSLIIGRRGDTMDAIQYLCTLVCNRAGGDEMSKLSLDVAGYRAKREKTLIALAEREAAKVKKSRYNKTLEPMNPYERRIVHSAIQEIEGVKSESVGYEPNRRVVISLISGGKARDGRPRPSGNFRPNNNSRGGYNNSKPRYERNDSAPAKPQDAAPVVKAPTEAKASPVDSSSLYKKIEL